MLALSLLVGLALILFTELYYIVLHNCIYCCLHIKIVSIGNFPFSFIHHRSQHESESHSVVSDSLRPHGLYSPWNSPGQNTGVGSLPLLQGIIQTRGSNSGLLHCRWILYQLNYQGSP